MKINSPEYLVDVSVSEFCWANLRVFLKKLLKCVASVNPRKAISATPPLAEKYFGL
jgi:hypothetical protein